MVYRHKSGNAKNRGETISTPPEFIIAKTVALYYISNVGGNFAVSIGHLSSVDFAELECGMEAEGDEEKIEAEKKWHQIFSYAFNESFNGCVAQLEEMETYTKMIVGEQG